MATDPLNPYAPTEALAHEVPGPETKGKPSRVGAVVTAILCYPLPGPSFHLLRLRRQAVVWTAIAVVGWALLIGSIRLPIPKLFLIAIIMKFALWLTSVVVTAIAKPGGVRLERSVLTAVLMIAAVWAGEFASVFVYVTRRIPSGTMMPTLLPGDHLVVSKGHAVQRGDVIVFEFPQNRNTDYVKRVVALGGDTIEVRDGVPSINGVPLGHDPIAAPCLASETTSRGVEEPMPCTLFRETNAGRAYTIMLTKDHPAMDHPRTVVPPGTVFVLGDNRDNSYDSRRWGTLDVDLITGRVTIVSLSTDAKGADRWSRMCTGVE